MENQREHRISLAKRWSMLIVAAIVLLGFLRFAQIGLQGNAEDVENLSYGFSGSVYRFGDPGHEVVYGEGVSQETLESLGVYLEQIGYFSAKYGGVIQIRSREHGYEVYLTYSKSYWDLPEFIEEVSSIREDLEANVLRSPTEIILADEDESGIYTRALKS